MKKVICTAMCLLMFFSISLYLTSCKNKTDEMGEQSVYTEKQMNKIQNKIFKYVNEQDKEGLKNLFSKDSQRKIEDLDSKLDQFISAFNGNKIESSNGFEPAFKGSEQTQPLHIYGKYHLKMDNGDKYIILINICDIDDDNKEKEGLFKITLLTFSKDEIPEGFRMRSNKDDYGVFVYTLQNYPKN